VYNLYFQLLNGYITFFYLHVYVFEIIYLLAIHPVFMYYEGLYDLIHKHDVNFYFIHGEVYSKQHYVIKFVSDLRQVSGFLRVLQFPSPIKLTTTI
jgi:hypothetical protein